MRNILSRFAYVFEEDSELSDEKTEGNIPKYSQKHNSNKKTTDKLIFRSHFMTITEVEIEIVEEFSLFTDWMDKYEYLIELGKSLPIIAETQKQETNLIKGCQSRVWLGVRIEDGKLFFEADSDAIITKGLISLLIRVYNGRTPEEILKSDFGFIEKIGLNENLSPTRANGLLSMIKQIQSYAIAYSSKSI